MLRAVVPGRTSQVSQSAAILKAMEASLRADVVREHVRRITESPAFKGSERSREFLQAIVEKSLAGHFEDLKERVLGVEIFGRKASYDTGEDAIVRVTAGDVRRRLLRYYSEPGTDSELRLDIPVGSYIPDFHWTAAAPVSEEPAVSLPEPPFVPVVQAKSRFPRKAFAYALAGFVLGMFAWGLGARFFAARTTVETLPWSSLLQSGRRLQIIVSDIDISKMQNLGGYDLSLSEYANHRYVPAGLNVSSELGRVLGSFRGLSIGIEDVSIALNVSKLAREKAQQISVLPARSVQLKDFRTDDNFVMLGSPRSDPWVSLFQEQLDFQFLYDRASSREVIRNRKPRKGELALYHPSARGWDTGEAFGIIAFVSNPNQSGHVLLLAGSNAEATEAAGKFALNREMMSGLLGANGISARGKPVSFQALLRVSAMAGSANSFGVIAFHRL